MFTNSWAIAKQAARDWIEDKASQLGAALAFYSILSIAPLVLIAIAIAALIFGEEAARDQIVGQIQGLVGQEGAEAIQEMLVNARWPRAGIASTILGMAVLLFGASGVFGQLQDSLNTIWEVRLKAGGGILGFLRRRFLSMAMVLGTGFLLLVSLVLTAALAAMGSQIGNLLPGWTVVLQLLNASLTFAVITVLFASIFKVLPDVKIQWRDVWVGAIVTALLFMLGKYCIGLYLARAAPGSTYGAAGSLVVLVLWVYYSAQILFFGAEITQAFAKVRGSKIVPSKGAEAIPDDDLIGTTMHPPSVGLPEPKSRHGVAALATIFVLFTVLWKSIAFARRIRGRFVV